MVKNLPAMQETWIISLGYNIYLYYIIYNIYLQKIPWRRKLQPTPVFLPGELHGQSSLAGYSPWVTKSWTQLSD